MSISEEAAQILAQATEHDRVSPGCGDAYLLGRYIAVADSLAHSVRHPDSPFVSDDLAHYDVLREAQREFDRQRAARWERAS